MTLTVNLTEKRVGALIKVTAVIVSCRVGEKELSERIDVNGIAFVEFHFNQVTEQDLFCQVIVQKQLTDVPVKVKVFSENLKYCSERILHSEEALWDLMGKLRSEIDICRRQIYIFNATISAYKAEVTVLEKLYKEIDSTDFYLTAADGRVPVHKLCLMTVSEVFKRMLNQEWKETDNGSMHLPVTLKTLQHLKQYIYLGTVPDDDLLPLLDLALCYMIKDLQGKCISKLAFSVKPEDWYNLLQYSMDKKIPELTFALIQTTSETVIEMARKMKMEQNAVGEPNGK